MAHYNEINVQNLYIACESLEDYINKKIEAMNLGGGDYTAVLTRMSDQILKLSNALQSADPDNAGVILLKTLSDEFAVAAGTVEGTSYSEIITKINSLTEIVSVVKKKIAVPIRTSTDSALEKKTGDMYYDQAVKKFAFVTESESDAGVVSVSNFAVEEHKHPEADVEGLTDKLNELKTSSDKVFQGMIEEKTDPADDIYKYYAVDGGEIHLGTTDKKLKGIYSETSDIERIVTNDVILEGNSLKGQLNNLQTSINNIDNSASGSSAVIAGYLDDFPILDTSDIVIHHDAIRAFNTDSRQPAFRNKVGGIQRINWKMVNEDLDISSNAFVDNPGTTTTYSCSGTSSNYDATSPTQVFIAAEKDNAVVYAYRFNSWRAGTASLNSSSKRVIITWWQKIV